MCAGTLPSCRETVRPSAGMVFTPGLSLSWPSKAWRGGSIAGSGVQLEEVGGRDQRASQLEQPHFSVPDSDFILTASRNHRRV